MPLKPSHWSVIIVGRWNRAILTPGGIAKRLFGLQDPTQLMVAVPLDGVSPYQVRHPTKNIIAMTDETRLRIHLAKQDYKTLEHAMAAGVEALKSLPETPVTAAGFNVDFHASELATEHAALLASEVDAQLGNLELTIAGRTLTRSLQYGAGQLNVTITSATDELKVSCNFHRGSKKVDELKDWLGTPVADVSDIVDRLLEALGLHIEEAEDGIDEE